MPTNCYEDTLRAEAYARLELGGTYALAYRDLPELLATHARGRRALDFGCGTGRSTRFLRRLGFEVVGVDVSAEMLAKAREIDPEGDYRLVPGDDFSGLQPASFDLILSAFTFDNVPGSAKAPLLRDLRRLLRPEGVVVLLGSSPEIYTHEWASFSTRDFPENREARNGDTVRIVVTDHEDRRPVEDVVWTDAAWRGTFREADLGLVERRAPLARADAPGPWVSETSVAPWVLYVLTLWEPHPVLIGAEAEGRSVLLEHEVYALVGSRGIAVPAHHLVTTPDAVTEGLCASLPAEEVVVKVVSPDLLHKSDVGGIAPCANRPAAVRDAVSRVLERAGSAAPGARLRGALIAERVRFRPGFGQELLLGVRHDRAFGPVVVAGVGGLDTEFLLAALAPERARAIGAAAGLTELRALALLRRTASHAALTGTLRSSRGTGVAEEKLAEVWVALARLAEELAGFEPPGGLGLEELELNPLVAAEGGRLVALDGLARIHRPRPPAPPRPVARLRQLLEPRSAVVIGASAASRNVGRVILGNLVEGGGIPREKIWAIHPRAGEIDGCRAFATPGELPEPADLAVMAIPADRGGDQAVIDLVTSRRARTLTLISGGFGETEAGRGAEARMREAIEASHRDPDGGVLVNGGNCLGIISIPGGYNTFFIPPHKLPFHDAPGQNVASISQSGAYLVTQISNLDRAVRPRYAISFGNQVDVTVSDYLDYLAADEAIRVFAVYLEGFSRGDGARFLEVAGRITASGRTVLLYKAGRTPEGRLAAASHTAAAVGDYEVTRELVRAAGVIDCFTLNMFEDYLTTFSFLADRAVGGRRVAILSNAGFECTAAADKLYGLTLATLAPETERRLRELLPAGVVDVHNPVDATPTTPTERYAALAQALLDDPGVDAVVVAGVPATPYLEDLPPGADHGEDVARETSLPSRLIRLFHATPKPMLFSVDSGPLYESCVQMMKRAGLPCFRKVDRATRALAAWVGARLGEADRPA